MRNCGRPLSASGFAFAPFRSLGWVLAGGFGFTFVGFGFGADSLAAEIFVADWLGFSAFAAGTVFLVMAGSFPDFVSGD